MSFTIEVFDSLYQKQGQLASYESCWVEWINLDVGTGELIINEQSDLVPLLLTVVEQPVLINVTVNGVRWPGRIIKVSYSRKGKLGTGTLTCSLVSEWIWLRYLLASQNGASPVLTGMPLYDTQTGPIATLAAYYINAAAARTGAPVIAQIPLGDETQANTLNARFPMTLSDLLTAPLAIGGMALDVDAWLPGDPAPLNITQDTPGVIFTPRMINPNPSLRWSENAGKISEIKLDLTGATGYRGLVELSGTGITQVYDYTFDPNPTGSTGQFALPEIAVAAGDAVLGTDSQQRGQDETAKHRATMGVSFVIEDGSPFTFGEDFRLGDLASIGALGREWRDQIVKVRASNTLAGGMVITPTLGDLVVSAWAPALLGRAIASLQNQIRLLRAGR